MAPHLVVCLGLLLNRTPKWRAEEALSGCVILTWAGHQTCGKTSKLPSHRDEVRRETAKLSSDPCVGAENGHHSFPATTTPQLDVYSPKTASLRRLLLPKIVKPVSLVQLYTISPASLFSPDHKDAAFL